MHGGVMKIEGNATTIHHNGTDNASRHCGLDPGASSYSYLYFTIYLQVLLLGVSIRPPPIGLTRSGLACCHRAGAPILSPTSMARPKT